MERDLPPYTVQIVDGVEVYTIRGPSMLHDKLISLHSEGANMIARRMGKAPVRASLQRWRTNGYPVDRNGPRVRLPHVVQLKRVKTSAKALSDWFLMIQALAEDIRAAGGVDNWRGAQNHE